jgi:hypothetical protein
MKQVLSFITLCSILFSCTQQDHNAGIAAKKTIDLHWLDSVIKYHSDSSYSKPYKRTDFVTASYYLNKKDSSLCEVMSDSSGTVRQVIIARKKLRSFYSQYYANGQLQAELPLDSLGQYHGISTYYYPNSVVESNGTYIHGLKNGKWKNFDESGKLTSVEEFNINGQLVKTTKN